MDRRVLLLLLCLGVSTLAYEKFSAPSGARTEAETLVVTTAVPAPAAEQQERARQQLVEEEQTRARIADLRRDEARQRERNRLGVEQERELSALQGARQALWTQVLHTNWPAYSVLRRQAELSPTHTTPCAFCDGRGKMAFCVVCGSSGKCPRCGGAGGACAACLGTGKCYLCSGIGKMACLFCDDGEIYAKLPPPSAEMPVPRNSAYQPQTRSTTPRDREDN